jgi:hypothetical protein
MGVWIYPLIQGEECEFDAAGKPLFRALGILKEAAKQKGLKTFMDLFDMTREQKIIAIGGVPHDPTTFNEAHIPEEVWFEPSEGLSMIEFCVEFVKMNGDKIKESDVVLMDLNECRRILKKAVELKKKFHFEISD